jgi:hypothetical protein
MKYDSDISSLIYKLSIKQRTELSDLIHKFKSEGVVINTYDKFTLDDIIEDIDSITRYEIKRKLEADAAEIGESTIPRSRWGVHETHCCFEHGCKYGDQDCPVVVGLTEQVYACDDCDDDSDFFKSDDNEGEKIY